MQPTEDVLIHQLESTCSNTVQGKSLKEDEVHPTAHLSGGSLWMPASWSLTSHLSIPHPPAWHTSGLTYCRKSFFIMLWSVRCSAGS